MPCSSRLRKRTFEELPGGDDGNEGTQDDLI